MVLWVERGGKQEVVANEGVVKVCREWPPMCSSLIVLFGSLTHGSLSDRMPFCLPIHICASLGLCSWIPKELH